MHSTFMKIDINLGHAAWYLSLAGMICFFLSNVCVNETDSYAIIVLLFIGCGYSAGGWDVIVLTHLSINE